jgi:CDP-2,3-bis-(O-geranylgeranyl)-sn-glycerol synthase
MDPLACAVFLIVAFVLAGVAQTLWLRSQCSLRFAVPLDQGRTFRGKRILGANKTFRGLMVMVPATGLAFCLLGLVVGRNPDLNARLWSLSPAAYAVLGLVAGLGFMLGELPNSFVKRQMGIPPGEAPRHRAAGVVAFVVDRFDSIVGMLAALMLFVPLPWRTWLYVIVLGPAIHWSFSLVLYLCGVKGRPA